MTPRLALSMIVRDAALDLPRCLESVRGVVDEMLLADSGSRDNTIDIARSFGAQVVSIPWENDFAKARNLALGELHAATRADWVLVLDADELLDAHAAAAIAPCLLSDEVAGYIVPIRNYFRSLNTRIWDRPAIPNDFRLPSSREFPAFVAHGNVRLFRRDPEIFFVGRVHESVGPRIVELGRKTRQCNLIIHHFGMTATAESRSRKNELYRELGRQKILEMPRNAQAHFELGLVEFDNFRDDAAALERFARACELTPQLAVAWLFRGMALLRLKRHAESLAALDSCEKLGYSSPLLDETRGDALYNAGHFLEASRAFARAIRKGPENSVLESKRGLALVRSGKKERGLALLRAAVQKQPQVGELFDHLIQALVWLGNLPEAASVADGKLEKCPLLTPADFLRAGSVCAQMGQWTRAAGTVQSGLRHFPDSGRLKALFAEIEVQQMKALASKAGEVPVQHAGKAPEH